MSDVRTFPDDDAATELETALLREVFSLTQLQSLTLESAAKAGYTAPWMVGAPGWTQEGRCKDFLDHCRFTSRHRLRCGCVRARVASGSACGVMWLVQ